MKKIQMHIEVEGDQAWAYTNRSCDYIPDAPLHKMLRWVLEQLNMGNCTVETDESDDAVSIMLGKEAAPTFDAPLK